MDLKSYLDTENIPVASFAEMIGVKRQTVYSYLSGKKFPSKKTMPKIKEATSEKVTADSFYPSTEHKDSKTMIKKLRSN